MSDRRPERDLQNAVRLKFGTRTDIKLFRNNTGMGWAGKLIRKLDARNGFTVTLENARPLHAGLLTGSADFIGWRELTITQEMVGHKIAQFTSIETKGKGTGATTEQRDWMRAVQNAGGIASILKNENDLDEIFKIK